MTNHDIAWHIMTYHDISWHFVIKIKRKKLSRKFYDYVLIDSFWGSARFFDSPTSYATLSHITTFEEMRRKTDTYWKLQGSTREPVRILCCQFFEKWNGRSVHCHRALQKTDCWESETDWNELWAHKFTLRAWKPIVTTSLAIHEDD